MTSFITLVYGPCHAKIPVPVKALGVTYWKDDQYFPGWPQYGGLLQVIAFIELSPWRNLVTQTRNMTTFIRERSLFMEAGGGGLSLF